MDIKLKQRVLGVIVLIALVGIILSVLLHNNKQAPTNNASSQVASVPAMTADNSNAAAPAPTTDPNLNNVNDALNTADNQNQTQLEAQAQAAQIQQAEAQAAATAAAQTAAQAQATQAAAAQVTSSVDASAANTTPVAPAATTPDATPAPAAPTPVAAIPTAAPSDSNDVNIPAITPTVPPVTVPAAATTEAATTIAAPEKEAAKVKHHHHHEAAKAAEENAAPAVAATTATTGEKNWTVQAGSFDEASHATELVKKLKAHGFEATAEKIHTSKGEMTRVIVGHADQTDASARELVEKLDKTMSLKAAIVPKQTKDLAAAQ